MIDGYCWPQSVQQNETVSVFCHGDEGQVHMQVIRCGAQDQIVFESAGITVGMQSISDDLSTNGCAWKPCAEILVESSWPSGFYLVRIIANDMASAEAFFVVRSIEPLDAILVLSTSTWAAYNNWGGPSFYTGGHAVSFERPLPKGFLHKSEPARHRIARAQDWSNSDKQAFLQAGYSQWCMAAGWANWEVLFVRWAESQGYELGYATSADLDCDTDLLSGYPAYLSVGHDEYWSANMRNNVEQFIDDGGNAAFFSGNTSFWQSRFENNRTRLVCFKNSIKDDPAFDPISAPELSTMWSDPLVGRPENAMTGVSFTRGGYASMPNAPRGTGGYKVWQPDHWAFNSVPIERGGALGSDAIVVGYECDGCELVEQNGVLVAAGGDGTPQSFEVLATAPAHLWETHEAVGDLHETYVGELNWVAERIGGGDTLENRKAFTNGHAVLGTFKRGKGEVFTTGCTDWAYGLSDTHVATVTNNVLQRFLLGRGK